MKIIFLKDYAGRETAMKEYKQGVVLDLDVHQALSLILLGVVEEVEETTNIENPKGKRRKQALGDEE